MVSLLLFLCEYFVISFIDRLNAELPLSAVSLDRACYRRAGVKVSMLRLDDSDAVVSGNKWYKLRYNLLEAKQQGARQVLSFGGAWSNHIHALAGAGFQLGIETVGIIRGESASASNAMLQDALRWGMALEFVSRADYRRRHEPEWIAELQMRWPDAFIVPEGGSNALAVKGVGELVSQITGMGLNPDLVIAPCGTGGTLAGVLSAAPSCWRLLGIPVLKGAGFLYDDISNLLAKAGAASGCYWGLDLEGHCRGYARTTPELLAFMSAFEADHAIELDQVYTGKMMYRLEQLVMAGTFPAGFNILVLHTGGVQGRRSLNNNN